MKSRCWKKPWIALSICAALISACAVPPVASTAPSAPTVPVATPSAEPTTTSAPQPASTRPPAPTQSLKPTLTPDARPAINTPDWFDEAILYEIFPRSFRDSDGDGVGDLKGVMQQLDYIQSLGATAIWLTPFYPSNTYHGYAVSDYLAVNSQFGTEQDFDALAAEMRKRGMKLIVDFVANHSSNAHPFFKDAYQNPASQYTNWYLFQDKNNTTYKSFFGVAELPEWNLENPKVVEYLTQAALFWLERGADGLRLDYALGVERPVWKQISQTIKAKHPDALLLGEIWDGNPVKIKRYFENGLDAAFDFPMYLTLSESPDVNGDGVLNGKGPLAPLNGSLMALQLVYPPGAQLVRFASNHDTNRIASDTEGNLDKMKLAATAVMLSPGVPMIYYGEEIGMRGVKGPGPIYDEYRREPLDWYASEIGAGMTTWFKPAERYNKPNDGVSVEEEENQPDSLLNHYRALAKLRADSPALRGNDFQVMQEVDGCERCLGLWRWAEGETAAMFLNFSGQQRTINFNAAQSSPVPLGDRAEFLLGESQSMNGLVIEPWGAVVIGWQTR